MRNIRHTILILSILIVSSLLAGCASEESLDSAQRAIEATMAPMPSVRPIAAAAPKLMAADQQPQIPLQNVQMNTEEYDRITDNPFRSVIEHPVSTFSIDADTASYANVRRFLTQYEQLPPEDAVRIEELLQYFPYSYDQPKEEHPIAWQLDAEPAPWAPEHQLLRVALQAESISTEAIPPSNLVFLIDTSGSMHDENKLPLLQKSMQILLEQMRAEDSVSIVAYAGSAGIILEATPGTERVTILKAFEQLEAGGSTAGGEGIELAYRIAKDQFIDGGNNRVILCTDGDFNVGVSSTGALVRLIEKKREEQVYLTILGFGMGNYKDSRMEALSNAGNGNYAYIDNLLEAKKVLGKEIWGNLYTVAKDVKIQIEFNPSMVDSYRLIGYENRMLSREDFDDDSTDAGEMGSGQSVTAFYELIPADGAAAGTSESPSPLAFQETNIIPSDKLLSFKLRYKVPGDGEEDSRLISVMKSAQELSHHPGETDIDYTFASAVVEFGMLLRRSPYQGDSTWEDVLSRARASKGSDEDGYRAEFIRLAELAQLVEGQEEKALERFPE